MFNIFLYFDPRKKEANGEKVKPHNETEAIAAIYKRVDEIKEELR